MLVHKIVRLSLWGRYNKHIDANTTMATLIKTEVGIPKSTLFEAKPLCTFLPRALLRYSIMGTCSALHLYG